MGAVKTEHKRDAHLRTIVKVCRKWDREDQALEQRSNRERKRRREAHKMKRLYPNSFAPERVQKEYSRRLIRLKKSVKIGIVGFGEFQETVSKAATAIKKLGKAMREVDGLSAKGIIFDEWNDYKFGGIDLASGEDQAGFFREGKDID